MNGVWGLYTPIMGLDLGSEIIILLGLSCAVAAALIAGRVYPKSIADQFFVAAPLGLLAGWLTAASFVGGSSVLLGFGIEITNVIMFSILAGATAFAILIIFMRPSVTYVVAIIWALAAIIFKNLDGGNQTIVFAAGIATVIILFVTLFLLKRRKA